jgi:catechol-2,3-dioxygenase
VAGKRLVWPFAGLHQKGTPVSLTAIYNLDYTILLCNKMAETKAFYRDVMKLPVETELESWVSFRVGGTLLTLRPRGPAPA